MEQLRELLDREERCRFVWRQSVMPYPSPLRLRERCDRLIDGELMVDDIDLQNAGLLPSPEITCLDIDEYPAGVELSKKSSGRRRW